MPAHITSCSTLPAGGTLRTSWTPKASAAFNRLYKQGDILTHGAHKFAPVKGHAKGGMTNEDFYAEFGRDLLAFNGLDYSVNNHSPGARYMATGKLDSLAYPTFAALVAACRGPSCPLAFLTFGNYSATGNLVAMSRVPYLPSLKKIANADAADGNERAPYHDPFAPRPHRAGAARRTRGPRRRPAAAADGARREHAVRGPGQLEGVAAGDGVHPGDDPRRSGCRSRPRSRWRRSRPASACPRT